MYETKNGPKRSKVMKKKELNIMYTTYTLRIRDIYVYNVYVNKFEHLFTYLAGSMNQNTMA